MYLLTGWYTNRPEVVIVENGKVVTSTISAFWRKAFKDVKRICRNQRMSLKFEKQLELNSKAVSSK